MLVLFLGGLTGCSTWEGMGKDVEKTGGVMQGKE